MKSFGLCSYALSGSVAVALLAGCGGSQPPTGAPDAAVLAAHAPASFVYMGQCCGPEFSNKGNVTLYDLELSKVARTITKGISNPWVITVDRAGRLYMVGFGYTQGVIEYDAGSDRPSRRIKLSYAWTAATDASNNLYAASCPDCHEYVTGTGSVNVYAAGTTKLLRSIKDGINSPMALAFDTNGNLYVFNGDGNDTAVLVYAPGASTPSRSLPQGYTDVSAIALDASNNLFVIRSPVSGQASIVEYKADSTKIVRTITKGIQSPQAIALDSSGRLYVANTPFPNAGWVSVYAPGSSTPSYRITSGMDDPQLLAIGGEGNLYVGNDDYGVALARRDVSSGDNGSLCAYAPKAKKPMRCIVTEQWSFPYSLAVTPK